MSLTGFTLSNRSARRMNGVHPLLVAAVTLAMLRYTTNDFGVAKDCVRTLDRQKELVSQGVSKTLKSKHVVQADGYSHAVDLYPGGYSSIEEIPDGAWQAVDDAMQQAAEDLGIKVEWGYDMWGWDKPHYQLADE